MNDTRRAYSLKCLHIYNHTLLVKCLHTVENCAVIIDSLPNKHKSLNTMSRMDDRNCCLYAQMLFTTTYNVKYARIIKNNKEFFRSFMGVFFFLKDVREIREGGKTLNGSNAWIERILFEFSQSSSSVGDFGWNWLLLRDCSRIK